MEGTDLDVMRKGSLVRCGNTLGELTDDPALMPTWPALDLFHLWCGPQPDGQRPTAAVGGLEQHILAVGIDGKWSESFGEPGPDLGRAYIFGDREFDTVPEGVDLQQPGRPRPAGGQRGEVLVHVHPGVKVFGGWRNVVRAHLRCSLRHQSLNMSSALTARFSSLSSSGAP